MTKRRLLLAFLAAIFLFAGTALVLHYSSFSTRYRITFRAANLPVGYSNGKVTSVMPDAAEAGVRVGDRIDSANGQEIRNDSDWAKAVASFVPDQSAPVVFLRSGDSGEERYAVALQTRAAARDFAFFAGFVTSSLYSYAIPTISILLAFWSSSFARPTRLRGYSCLFCSE